MCFGIAGWSLVGTSWCCQGQGVVGWLKGITLIFLKSWKNALMPPGLKRGLLGDPPPILGHIWPPGIKLSLARGLGVGWASHSAST